MASTPINSKKLRHLMVDRDWNISQMAAEMGITQGALCNVLNGKRGVGSKFLIALGRVVPNPMEYILNDVKASHAQTA